MPFWVLQVGWYYLLHVLNTLTSFLYLHFCSRPKATQRKPQCFICPPLILHYCETEISDIIGVIPMQTYKKHSRANKSLPWKWCQKPENWLFTKITVRHHFSSVYLGRRRGKEDWQKGSSMLVNLCLCVRHCAEPSSSRNALQNLSFQLKFIYTTFWGFFR